MKLKVDSSKSPAFNYFVIRINQSDSDGDSSANIQEAYKAAIDYIQKRHPQAKLGSNYWLRALPNVPLVDQYFLRCLTFRSCIPPYRDVELEIFGKKVESFVQQEAEVEVTASSELSLT